MIVNVELCQNRINLTQTTDISSQTIENTIRGFTYTGEKRAKDVVVENLKLPPFALSFYSLVFLNNSIPSEDEFLNYYLSNKAFRKVGSNQYLYVTEGKEYTIAQESLEARALRTYPSLIRDIHFYFLATESKLFQAVHYSFKNDYYNMVDLRIKYHDDWFDVGLFIRTKRATEHCNKKPSRHNSKNDVIYLDLSLSDCQKCGSFYLYQSTHVTKLHSMIQDAYKNKHSV